MTLKRFLSTVKCGVGRRTRNGRRNSSPGERKGHPPKVPSPQFSIRKVRYDFSDHDATHRALAN
jgi:hypothetical protein